MRKTILLSLFCLLSLVLVASDKVRPLNVKTGLWETTWTSTVSGRPPIPEEALARMTPDQRARLEAAMGKMGSQVPKTHTAKSCLTKEKLEKDPFSEKADMCTETVLTSTGSKMDVKEVCTNQGAKTDVTVHIEATDSEHVKGSMESNTSSGGNTMKVSGTFTSKWIGATCTP